MRSMVFAACAVVALAIAAPAVPAEPAGAKPPALLRPEDADSGPAGTAKITFEEYRDWRLAAMERRRSEIEVQLSAADLPPPRKARLEETRAYYKWLAGLSGRRARPAFSRALRPDRRQSRRRHRRRRAHRLARAATGLLRRRGQRRERASRRARQRRTGKKMRPLRPPPFPPPDRLAFARSVLLCCTMRSSGGRPPPCYPARFAPAQWDSPRWAGLATGRPRASFRRCCCRSAPISRERGKPGAEAARQRPRRPCRR